MVVVLPGWECPPEAQNPEWGNPPHLESFLCVPPSGPHAICFCPEWGNPPHLEDSEFRTCMGEPTPEYMYCMGEPTPSGGLRIPIRSAGTHPIKRLVPELL